MAGCEYAKSRHRRVNVWGGGGEMDVCIEGGHRLAHWVLEQGKAGRNLVM